MDMDDHIIAFGEDALISLLLFGNFLLMKVDEAARTLFYPIIAVG